MRIDAVTIFPDYFAPLTLSLLGKASEAGIVDFHIHDLREPLRTFGSARSWGVIDSTMAFVRTISPSSKFSI